MRFEDIWPIVVDGGKVTCDRLGEGVFIDYAFSGLRINHPHGGQSGFKGTEADREAEWREITDEDEAKAEARREAAKPDKIDLPGVTSREQAERLAKSASPWRTGPKAIDNKPAGVLDPRSAPIEDVEYGEPKKALPVWPKTEVRKDLPKWK